MSPFAADAVPNFLKLNLFLVLGLVLPWPPLLHSASIFPCATRALAYYRVLVERVEYDIYELELYKLCEYSYTRTSTHDTYITH